MLNSKVYVYYDTVLNSKVYVYYDTVLNSLL